MKHFINYQSTLTLGSRLCQVSHYPLIGFSQSVCKFKTFWPCFNSRAKYQISNISLHSLVQYSTEQCWQGWGRRWRQDHHHNNFLWPVSKDLGVQSRNFKNKKIILLVCCLYFQMKLLRYFVVVFNILISCSRLSMLHIKSNVSLSDCYKEINSR